MPRFFKQNLLTPQHLLEKPNELPPPPPPLESGHQEEMDLTSPLVVWTAPSRPYRKKDRSFFTTAITIAILFSLLAIMFKMPLAVGPIVALVVLVYALNYVPPEDVENKISAQGVTSGGNFYHWRDLSSFWLNGKDQNRLLYIKTRFRFPGVLILVLGNASEEQVKKTIARFLPFEEIAPRGIIDNLSEGLQKHFPLETPRH